VPRFAEETIQQVAAANDIVEVIGGYFPLKRAGTAYKALCPFHQEGSPSFTVNPARQIFKCFGCGAGGSVFRFVMDYEHVDFSTALRRLAERAGIRLEEQEFSAQDRERLDMRRRLLELHADAAAFFHRTLLKSAGAQNARSYLNNRGIHAETAKSWQLGHAPDGWDTFLRWATDRGFSQEELLASGLITQRDPDNSSGGIYDRFRNRVMFPICNDTGEVIAFSGRILEADAKAAKYVNSPETILFSKGAVLFGLHRSKRALIEKSSAIVCEGQLDLIAAFEAGIQNVIAPQGTAFTPKQARILRRYVEEVVLCFDSDAAGEKAAERSLPSLFAEKLSVRVVQMPAGQDPDSLIRTQGADAFRQTIAEARDFFQYQLRNLAQKPDFQTPRGRAAAARKLAEFLGCITDPMLKEVQIQQVATSLGLGVADFANVVRETSNRPQAGVYSSESEPGHGPELEEPPQQIILEPTLRLLALVLLHSREARDWLLEEDWRTRLEAEPQADVLVSILEAANSLESPGGTAVYLATLSPSLESVVSTLLNEKPPEQPLPLLHDCWNELEKKQVRRLVESLKARQRAPRLALEEAASLHQQILDLQKRLLDIARPFSPPQ
jgi:DNA primase